jgi:hypothetical protein
MADKENEKIIPDQRVGKQLDTDYEYRAGSDEEARAVFEKTVANLLDVNSWDKLCGPLSAKFQLTDARGDEVKRQPQTGDHFKIDVPGPGPSSGDGYDWVQVEALEDRRNPSADQESVTIRVRPATSPLNDQRDTAHFFHDEATSSFRVQRIGNLVKAEVHGRNEVPNTDAEKVKDKVRNAVVGSGAVAGLSAPQWKSLVKGLIEHSK